MVSDDYADLGLEEILQLSRADEQHVPDMVEQADGAEKLRLRVERALDAIDAAARKLSGSQWGAVGQALEGHSGDAAISQVRKLSDLTVEARHAIEPQPRVFGKVAERALDTHRQLSGLHEERESWLRILREDPDDADLRTEFGGFAALPGSTDPAELEREIRDRYDSDAREAMSQAGNGYLTEVEQLAEVPSYTGPRVPRPVPDFDAPDADSGYRSGPVLEPRRYEPAAAPPATAPVAPPVTDPTGPHQPQPGPGEQPQLQTPAPGTPPVTGPPPATGPGPMPVGDVFVPGKPVLPPVIGARPSLPPSVPRGSTASPPQHSGPTRAPTTPAPTANRGAPARLPGGLTRPVIGGRTGTPASTRGGTAPRTGVVRPGTGATAPRTGPVRPGTGATGIPAAMSRTGRPAPGVRGTAAANPAVPGTGRTAAAINRPVPGVSRLGTNPVVRNGSRPGSPTGPAAVRAPGANPRAHEPQGKVIGRRAAAPDAKQNGTRAGVSRSPRVVHGGNENLNRAVIRNMRSASSTPRPRPVTDDNDDFDWKEDERR